MKANSQNTVEVADVGVARKQSAARARDEVTMPTGEAKRLHGWAGIGLIAVTYVYFLIFAQLGFLKRLLECGVTGNGLKAVMGAMAAGGILASLTMFRLEGRVTPVRRMRFAFALCAAGALLTLPPLDLVGGMALAALIGLGLGCLTVTLVTHLHLWIGSRRALLKMGVAVGFAYLVCNDPGLFQASTAFVAVFSGVICVVGILLAGLTTNDDVAELVKPEPGTAPYFLPVLIGFTALIWLDSAAFYIIQNTPSLKAGTWEGSHRLWQNGGVHVIAAVVGALVLGRWGLTVTLGVAFGLLGAACLLLGWADGAVAASVAYPAGVSVYSVALVAYPAYLAGMHAARDRAWRAGWLYAVAGWLGSGLGIIVATDLQRIPPMIVVGAALVFFVSLVWMRVRRFTQPTRL